LVQHPLGGGGVDDHRDDIVLNGLVQQEPGIAALLLRLCFRGGELESAAADESGRNSQHPRPPGLIETATTGVVSCTQPGRIKCDPLERSRCRSRKTELLAPDIFLIQILKERHVHLGQERAAAASRILLQEVLLRLTMKRLHRYKKESSAGDKAGGQD